MKRNTVIALLCLLAAAVAANASARPTGAFTQKGVVTEIVDGDTLRVRLAGGKSERVRLIGIDAAERGACFAAPAAARARLLALSKPVVLRGDATQDTRDRYGRLLAYVWLPGGRDLGYQLVAGGFAKVYVYSDPFERLSAYRTAERRAKSAPSGAVEGLRQHDDPPRRTVTVTGASCGRELSPELHPLPADRRRPRLRRRARTRRRPRSRLRVGSVPARRRRGRLRLRVTTSGGGR